MLKSVSQIMMPALSFLFGLQVIRVFVPSFAWMLSDRFDIGAVELGVATIVIFSFSFLSGSLRNLLGSRRSIIFTAGGLGLWRLLMQFQWPDPLVDLALATLGTIFFVLFLPICLDEARFRDRRTVGHFTIGLLLGLALDTTIHGAFKTYDVAWQTGLPALLVTLVLVLILWFLLATIKTTGYLNNVEDDSAPAMRPLPGLAIGLFLFLQLIVFQNIARLAVLTNWQLPFAFGWVLLAQLAALFVAAWLLGKRWQNPWLLTLIAGIILLVITAFSYPEEPWLAALVIFTGQVSASVLVVVILIGISEHIRGARFFSINTANGLGMLLLVLFLLSYYAVYHISLPYSNTTLELLAALGLTGCALASCGTIEKEIASGHMSWAAPLLSLFLLILPIAGTLTWREAETAAGDGFPVRIMTYNLHNGFNSDGYLNMETIARTIEESHPDIVALQEVSRGWLINGRLDMLAWLSQRLNMPVVSGPTADPLWGNAILTRHPIINSSNLALPPRDLFILRGFVSAVVDIGNGDTLQVITTHYHHLEQDSDVRQLQTLLITEYWNGAKRTVILGDLNAEPDTPEINMLRKAGLLDAQAGVEPPTGYTYHSANLYRRIDYIWLSPDLTIKEAHVPLSTASDHLPVVAVVDQ